MDKSVDIPGAPEIYCKPSNPVVVVAEALLFLQDAYAKASMYDEFAKIAEHEAEEQRYRKRALRIRAKAIVKHDRVITK